ncbi:hypothetical protein DPMN_114261 [Dreissena polymorpha]|uniref:Uncharacterized protein n=1 Tax=Dreissena polymorpha TaxID=45954 RepID=A0A9D4KJP1_DREPO|nr:hypothetical protein DPMN_114261 [Dreissena polymorpha]
MAITTLTKLWGRNFEVDSSSLALEDGLSFWLGGRGTNLISSSSSSSSASSVSRVTVWSSLKRTFLGPPFSPRENFRVDAVRMKSLGRDSGRSVRSLEGLSTEIGSGVYLYGSGRQSEACISAI